MDVVVLAHCGHTVHVEWTRCLVLKQWHALDPNSLLQVIKTVLVKRLSLLREHASMNQHHASESTSLMELALRCCQFGRSLIHSRRFPLLRDDVVESDVSIGLMHFELVDVVASPSIDDEQVLVQHH